MTTLHKTFIKKHTCFYQQIVNYFSVIGQFPHKITEGILQPTKIIHEDF